MTIHQQVDLVARFPQYAEHIHSDRDRSYEYVEKNCVSTMAHTCPIAMAIDQEMRRKNT